MLVFTYKWKWNGEKRRGRIVWFKKERRWGRRVCDDPKFSEQNINHWNV